MCRRHIHAWAVLVLSAATLALAAAAVASGSHRRSFERPLATHNTLVGIGSSPKRSAVPVAPTAPRTQEEQQQTTPPGNWCKVSRNELVLELESALSA